MFFGFLLMSSYILERCPSGLRCRPGKSVYVYSVPRVRISPAPPLTTNPNDFHLSADHAGGVFVSGDSQKNIPQTRKLGSKVGSKPGKLLSTSEASKRLGITERSVRTWCESGRLPSVQKPYGRKTTYLVSLKAVEVMLLEQAEQALISKGEPEARQSKPHVDYVIPWKLAMEGGLMTGRVFSPLTVEFYVSFTEKFLAKYHMLNLENLKASLLDVPQHQFCKRFKLYKSLMSFAKFLVQQKELPEDFPASIKPLYPKRHNPPKRTTVDEEGLSKLIGACKSPEDRLSVILLATTGLRASEACSLQVEDIDLNKGYLLVKRGKGGKHRTVGLSKGVLDALNDCLYKYEKENHQALFINAFGEPLDRYGLAKRLERIGKHAGVKVSPHALRRAFVTINANKGRPLQMLQIACGHSDIKTTMSYCRTTEQEVIDAMKGWD
jgi:integrase/recombinase XerD